MPYGHCFVLFSYGMLQDFQVVSRFHENAVTALFGCNIYTRTPPILFHRQRGNFFLSMVARASRLSSAKLGLRTANIVQTNEASS